MTSRCVLRMDSEVGGRRDCIMVYTCREVGVLRKALIHWPLNGVGSYHASRFMNGRPAAKPSVDSAAARHDVR